MKTIFKYDVPINDYFIQEIPEGAEFLTAFEQGSEAQMWFVVDTDKPLVEKKFRIFGTGAKMPDTYEWKTDPYLNYLTTFPMENGNLIWHLFEQRSEK